MAHSAPHTISWDAYEYPYHEKTVDWFWSLGIITLALMVVAIYQQNFLFGILVLLGCFSILLYAIRKPRIITVTVSGRGIQIGDRLFPFDGLQSFWIFYRPGGHKEISFKSNKTLMPYIKVPLGGADPVEVREILKSYIPEKTQEESLMDTISDKLKF